MGLHLGIGLGLSFSYILFQTITSTFAINGNVPPAVSLSGFQTYPLCGYRILPV